MSIEKLRSNIKINGILAIIGAVLIVVSLVVGMALGVMYGMRGGDPIQAGLRVAGNPLVVFLKIVLSLLGVATIVLGAMFISQGKKVNLTTTAGVLTIIAGAFTFFLSFVSLVLWIIAAVQFFKIQVPDQTNQAGPVDSSGFEG